MNKNEILTVLKETKENTTDFIDMIAKFVVNHLDDNPDFLKPIIKCVIDMQKNADILNAQALEAATAIKEFEEAKERQ